MTLPDLIDRLTMSEGPSRELDWRIAEQFNIPEEWRVLPMWPPFMKGSKFEKEIPAFTASIDAAIALKDRVLPDHSWSLNSSGAANVRHPKLWEKMLTPEQNTPAIALVIATLKALAEHEEAGR